MSLCVCVCVCVSERERERESWEEEKEDQTKGIWKTYPLFFSVSKRLPASIKRPIVAVLKGA